MLQSPPRLGIDIRGINSRVLHETLDNKPSFVTSTIPLIPIEVLHLFSKDWLKHKRKKLQPKGPATGGHQLHWLDEEALVRVIISQAHSEKGSWRLV